MGWKVVEGDPFAEDELSFDDLLKKKREEPTSPPGSTEEAGLFKSGEKYTPFGAFGQTTESPASALEKPRQPRPDGMDAFADPQQYKEAVRGIPSGAVRFVGTSLQGLGAVPARVQAAGFQFGKDQQALWDRIDRGERIPEMDDPAGYQHMDAEQRKALRADAVKATAGYRPTPLAEQPLYKAGEAVKDYGKTILPAAPGYEDAYGRQLGEGLGSLIAGLPFGVAGRVPGTIFFGAGGAGEAATRAIAYDQAEKRAGRTGLTQDQINTAALYGVGPGVTDMLPVETLLGRLRVPPMARSAVARVIGRIGGQAFVEGVQEGGQGFLQNAIARDLYNPQQGLTEGVAGEAAVGGGVGAVAETAKELAALTLRGMTGARRGSGATPEGGSGAPADPFAQPLTPAPGGAGVTITRPEPIDVTFEDLIPADRLPAPRPSEPVPQAGAESPSLPPASPSAPAGQPPALLAGPSALERSPAQARPPENPVEAAPVPASEPMAQDRGRRGVDVLQFIRSKGGLKPSRELGAMDARRYPGLINRNGLDADKMREAMVEAGYLQESAPDQPAITTPADVYDLLGRSISGERIVPEADRAGDEAFRSRREARDAQRELQGAEKTFVQPEIARYDAEIGGNGDLWRVYLELSSDDKNDVIDRNRRGADIVDLLEEKTLQNPIYYALGAPVRRAKASRDNLGFYSKALESAKALKQEKGTSEQMLAQLRTAGVKEAEIKATGLDKFLAERPSITKQEITEFLDKNRVGLRESRYGGKSDERIALDKELDEITARRRELVSARFAGDRGGFYTPEEIVEDNALYARAQALRGEIQKAEANAEEPKWREYSLDPSNPTYRESVIHLEPEERELIIVDHPDGNGYAIQNSRGAFYEVSPGTIGRWSSFHGANLALKETLSKQGLSDFTPAFRSGHWDEPNIVAHARTGEYQDTKGRKVFLIDELQSDWGQALREDSRDEAKIDDLKAKIADVQERWSNDSMLKELHPETDELIADIYRQRGATPPESRELALQLVLSNPETPAPVYERVRDLRDAIVTTNRIYTPEITRLESELKQEEAKGKTPSHPLVNTTDQWVTTAMRRIIQQAADAGADGISLTPGSVQNERFSLEKHIDSIDVSEPLNGELRGQELGSTRARQVVLNGRSGAIASGYFTPEGKLIKGYDNFRGQEGKSLGELIGKEMADRVLGTPGAGKFVGQGLKIGGEGMRATYDGIYPRILLKLVQKLDPSIRPEKTKLMPSDEEDSSAPGTYAMNLAFNEDFVFIPLTEKAKEKLADEGQPMFAIGAPSEKGRKRTGDGSGRDARGSLAPLKGAPVVEGATGPDPGIVAAAEDYARSVGIDLKRQAVFAKVDEALATRIAGAYEAMQHNPADPKVRAAYDDMIVQTINQYRALERAGYKFFFYDEKTDPYEGNPWNSIRDLRTNQRMGVFATEAGFGSGVTDLNTDDSPMLMDTGIEWPYGSVDGPKKRVLANDLFRAVHDAFGHSMEGAGFRARGEENAWQAHIRLYTGLAVGAVTSETRGQNSWLNFGPYGEANQTASVEDTVFADQKIGLMPEWTWSEGRVGDMPDTERAALGDGDITDTPEFKRWFGDSKAVGYGGAPKMLYHATLNDFEAFSRHKANPESDMGAGFYLTDTQEDAANNYAHEYGPDIRNRIEREADRLLGDDEFLADIIENNKGLTPDDDGWINEGDAAREAAKAQLGMAHEGMTLPVYLSIQNPVVIGPAVKVGGPQNETSFDFDSGEIYDPEADDYDYGEPSGKLAEFFDAFREVAIGRYDMRDDVVDRLVSDLAMKAEENGGSIGAQELVEYLKRSDFTSGIEDDQGRLARSEMIRRTFEEMGFDGIVDHTVSSKWGQFTNGFGGMNGVYPDTIHYIAFKPNQIKSAFNRGAFDPEDDRISYAAGAAMRDRMGALLRLGRTITIPHADQVLEAAAKSAKSLPQEARIAVLERVEPVPGDKRKVRAHFKTSDGPGFTFTRSWEDISSLRALFLQQDTSEGFVALIRLAAPSGSDERLGGEVHHEAVHALRAFRKLLGPDWTALLNHAKKLRILSRDLRDYLRLIGGDYTQVEPGLTLLDAYLDRYNSKSQSDLFKAINEEYVAHMVELYSGGHLSEEEVAPVQDILDRMMSGDIAAQPARPQVSAGAEMGAFAGPWAKTAKQNTLLLAQMMADKGKDSLFIWRHTGWFRSADGRWKFEISDAAADWQISDAAFQGFDGIKVYQLADVLYHPQLFKAYPQLAKMELLLESNSRAGTGGFNGNNVEDDRFQRKFIVLGTNGYQPSMRKSIMATLVHEVQHAIQDIENFAQGTGPQAEAETFMHRLAHNRLTPLDEKFLGRPDIAKAYDAYTKVAMAAKAKPDDAGIKEAADFFTRRFKDFIGVAMYGASAGEVEASKVAERMDYDAERRRQVFPQTIPSDEQHVKLLYGDDFADDAMLALAGKRAIGAPQNAFTAAERMEGRGRKPEEIWQSTGTYRGIEGKQRWEIDDSGAKIIGLDKAFETPKKTGFISRLLGRAPAPRPGVKEANNVPLINVLHHPKLFNAYPFLRQMRVNLAYGDGALQEGTLKSRMKGKTRVYLPIEASGSTPHALLEVLMHEIQHYIQEREGFARGSDVSMMPSKTFSKDSNALYDPGADLSEEQRNHWRYTARDKTLLKMTNPESIAFKMIETFERLDQEINPNFRAREEAYLKQLGEALEESMLVKRDDYLSSYGEGESNAVEKRLGLTAEQRRARFPGNDLPEGLRDTTNQTRNYDKAYEEIMRRALVFKQIKERWAQHKELGDGITVVRPDEELLVYGKGPDNGLIEAQLFPTVAGAQVSVWPEFLDKPYHEQKKIMDTAMKDLRSRNVRPSFRGAPDDNEFAFWAKYDPRMVAFDPRLYRAEIEEMAKAKYGPDATIEFNEDGDVTVTSHQVRIDYEKLQMDVKKADAQVGKMLDAMHKKYGSDYRNKMSGEEKQKLNEASSHFDELSEELFHLEFLVDGKTYLDLTPIFEGRTTYGAPSGVDREMYLQEMTDEQLDRWGKLPQPGDDVDFSDLVRSQ
jgi:hypothetical protein